MSHKEIEEKLKQILGTRDRNRFPPIHGSPALPLRSTFTTIISREEARNRGLVFFFTGIMCESGHIAQRYVSSYFCRQCLQTDDGGDTPVVYRKIFSFEK